MATDEAAEIKKLKTEVRKLKRADEILLAVPSSFTRESPRDCRGSRLHRRWL